MERTAISGALVIRALNQAKTKGAILFREPPNLAEEGSFPVDDLYIIRLAVHTRSILVTNDCRMTAKEGAVELAAKYNLRIGKPNELNP